MYRIPDEHEDSFYVTSKKPSNALALKASLVKVPDKQTNLKSINEIQEKPKSSSRESNCNSESNSKIIRNHGKSRDSETQVGLKDISEVEADGDGSMKLAATSGTTALPYSILVNSKQKGNPILKFVRNVPWEYADILPDYEMGRCTCALYLSLKYHNSSNNIHENIEPSYSQKRLKYPEYIHKRLNDLGKAYDLRVLLAQVDTKQLDVSHELNELARICMLADCTLIVAFSCEEAGRYLEVYKAYENKPPNEIMGKTNTDFLSQATECLTSVKGVNKTDSTTLLSNFKTMKAIIQADVDALSLCPGVGPLKARRLHKVFTDNFLIEPKVTRLSQQTIINEKKADTPADKSPKQS